MKFQSYLKAGYPLIWVPTHEEKRAMGKLMKESGGEYLFYSWDNVGGIVDYNKGETKPLPDPLKALNLVREPALVTVKDSTGKAVIERIEALPEYSVLFVKDFHKWIKDQAVFRTIKNLIPILEDGQKHIVFLSPVIDIPIELTKDITVIDLPLPDAEEMMRIAGWAKTQAEKDNPVKIEIKEDVIRNSVGLTSVEARNAFMRSIVETKGFDKAIIESEKLQSIKKTGLMEISQPIPESEIGGLDKIREYIHNRAKGFTDPNLPTPKGFLAVGLPGSGKSLCAKVVASILNLPLITANPSNLMGGRVGETEEKTRQFCQMADAVSPCVIFFDEIEKALGGVQSSNRSDSGAKAAMFGYLLNWMQESTKLHYIVATCNDIGELLAISQGALLRRFDDVFFFDLPNPAEKVEILKIMNRRYKTNFGKEWIDRMENFTGAEIEKFVKASIYDGTETALANVKPIYLQNQTLIDEARRWALLNARPASTPVARDQKQEPKERKVRL
jgi:ATP-dependent 26S proteasome regulatory subunit